MRKNHITFTLFNPTRMMMVYIYMNVDFPWVTAAALCSNPLASRKVLAVNNDTV